MPLPPRFRPRHRRRRCRRGRLGRRLPGAHGARRPHEGPCADPGVRPGLHRLGRPSGRLVPQRLPRRPRRLRRRVGPEPHVHAADPLRRPPHRAHLRLRRVGGGERRVAPLPRGGRRLGRIVRVAGMTAAAHVQKRWSTDQLITGIELQEWVQLLQKNRWRVDPLYLHRLAWVGGFGIPTTVLGRLEDMRYGRKLANQEIDPAPLFVIGHWRSGTTHLHNLLGRLPGHTYPTVFQVVFPTCFLMTDQILPRLTAGMLDGTRNYDNVKHGWNEAAEDEIALAKLTGLSPYVAFMFPENAARYERYIDFLESPTAEKEKWKDAFRYFLKKIMLQTGGKQVVVKSCTHTARIRILLEMFPN